MPNLEIDFPLQDGRKPLPGFRLRRLEVLNWGTFHGKISVLAADGKWTLLVGENGSGKSTAVDALRTLLVPPRMLNYNDASGEQKRRDRTRLSYIRGTWATVSQEESATAIPQHLRGPGNFSNLLAVFANEHTGEAVTLAQILWESGEKASELYLISRTDRNIREHLSNLGPSREFKKTLRSRGFDSYDSFSAYSEVFRSRLGIPNETALEVFNQAIGVKEVLDINRFIRLHMLEGSDALDFIQNRLRPHFSELDACWRAIEKAEKQLAALAPIVECHRKIEEALAKKREFDSLLERAPFFYAHRHLELREEEARRLEEELTLLNQQKKELAGQRKTDEAERDAKLMELSSNTTQQSIERIQTLMTVENEKLENRRRRRNEFTGHLKKLSIHDPVESAEQFSAICVGVKDTQGLIEGNRKAADDKRVRCLMDRQEAIANRERISSELESLRKNRVLIPRDFVAVREAVAAATGIVADDLPFAGELMEVKADYREWTGAIERLLHQFGVSMLVAEQHYETVARFINEEHLRTRFTFHRIPAQFNAPLADQFLDRERVPARLNFKEDHHHIAWVKSEVIRRFNHVCCRDIQKLKTVDYGLTREGLIRDGPTRHTKDDRKAVNDVTNYVLGWSVEDKIAALTREYSVVEKKIVAAEVKASEAEKQVRKFDDQLEAIRGIIAVGSFTEIDFRSVQVELNRLKRELDELESSSEQLQVLKRQLESIERRLKRNQVELDELTKRIGANERDRQNNDRVLRELRQQIRDSDTAAFTQWAAEFDRVQEVGEVTLGNIRQIEDQVRDRLTKQAARQLGFANTATNEMLPHMQNFLRDYAEHSANLRAGAEFAADFATLREQISRDDLPKHKQRFEEFLGHTLIGEMAQFQTMLLNHDKEIRMRVDAVNASLRKIAFSESTHVQIVASQTRADDIGQFRAKLRACLEKGLKPDDEDRLRIFTHIRELIAQFEKDEPWAKRVTDARNWLEFGVREIADADKREVNYYSASSGKSGGQKAKLAFTILASAITAQYGLVTAESDAKTFRLVVIDEAFARTDEANSQRALELFKKLDLQLIIVSPFDAKSRIVENYVDSFHLAVNPDGNNSRLCRASRAEYESALAGNSESQKKETADVITG